MGTCKHTAMDVKNWFLAWTYDDPEAYLDNLKIQKLLFFAQGYSLALLGRPIFDDEIEADDNGPVVRKVMMSLPPGKEQRFLEEDFDFADFSEEESQLLARVWETYGGYPSVRLAGKTHKEGTPWRRAMERKNPQARYEHISTDEIGQYFMGALAGAYSVGDWNGEELRVLQEA